MQWMLCEEKKKQLFRVSGISVVVTLRGDKDVNPRINSVSWGWDLGNELYFITNSNIHPIISYLSLLPSSDRVILIDNNVIKFPNRWSGNLCLIWITAITRISCLKWHRWLVIYASWAFRLICKRSSRRRRWRGAVWFAIKCFCSIAMPFLYISPCEHFIEIFTHQSLSKLEE